MFFLVSVTVFILVWWLVFEDVRKGVGYGIFCSTGIVIGHWLIQPAKRRSNTGRLKQERKTDQ